MSRTTHPGFAPAAEPLDGMSGDADYDALAELFLGQDQAAPAVPAPRAAGVPSTQPSPASSPSTLIEGLVLGHLPVLASAWVQQYARHLAGERGGPVALLRLRSGEAQLDVIGARHEPASLHTSLESAMREATSLVAAWLVRVDETTEPRLLELPGMAAVTLLTGADEAAIVSAYRTLKNLVRPTDEGDGPDLRIAIMGATPEKAAEATTKLERAAAAFLGRPVRIASCIARIGSKPSAVLYRGPWVGTVDEAIASVQAEVRRFPPVQAPLAPASPPREQTVRPTAAQGPAHGEVVSRLGRLHPGPVATPSVPCGPLAAHVSGLRGLELECPYAAGVEFAVDGRGVMHVLGRLDACDLSGLLTAAAWVRSHQSLLRMALSPQLPGFEGAEPSVLHLFADDARRVRALGDSPVRLHLLARVDAGGSAAWFSTPLN